jgi:hypothetical protein
MVENRLDTLYVVTTPDKPFGASDAIDEMFSSKSIPVFLYTLPVSEL